MEYTYPYLLAWERMMHSSERYLNQRLALAVAENAPHDAMWRSINGKWHLFSEMADHNHNKALIAACVRKELKMSRLIECPKCSVDISDSYQPAEPDVGIMGGGWFCDACNLAVDDEDGPEPHDDDVQVSGMGGSSHICACGTAYEMGYGLAGGGGIGPYMYRPSCGVLDIE